MKPDFNVLFLEEALTFYNSLNEQVKTKVVYNIQRCRKIADAELFRKINNHIWEFRTYSAKNQIRFFAFWDPLEKSLVVCTHGIFKKTQKTPLQEIDKAEKIRIQYLKEKYHEKK
jgi:phage-related protein